MVCVANCKSLIFCTFFYWSLDGFCFRKLERGIEEKTVLGSSRASACDNAEAVGRTLKKEVECGSISYINMGAPSLGEDNAEVAPFTCRTTR